LSALAISSFRYGFGPPPCIWAIGNPTRLPVCFVRDPNYIYTLRREDSHDQLMHHFMKRIVLTGGPCSGKTAVATALACALPHVVAIAEAATQIYSADGSRWDLLDLEAKRDRQRQIYQLQIRQEDHAARHHPDKLLLMDRGTIDGAAYWPEGSDAYWPEMGTTHEVELARYDLVILMQTAAVIGIYDRDSNSCRFEDPAGAIASTRLLERLWSGHRNLISVSAYPTLPEKIAAVKRILDDL